ncbi:hypothetical protein M569_15939 [Genlisea aurea]|uniref:Uncharacterized protein n=1 Tax=Genlisea aurea TaxID=192259 RepID=S8D880_9LAMI|nr:hypothetical protein M569_15939 [Genlisea aurea]
MTNNKWGWRYASNTTAPQDVNHAIANPTGGGSHHDLVAYVMLYDGRYWALVDM